MVMDVDIVTANTRHCALLDITQRSQALRNQSFFDRSERFDPWIRRYGRWSTPGWSLLQMGAAKGGCRKPALQVDWNWQSETIEQKRCHIEDGQRSERRAAPESNSRGEK